MGSGLELAHPPVPREPVRIRCADGYELAGFFHPRPPSLPAHGAVLLSPATGVPQGYYSAFAAHLASHGFATLTYDYRGIGRSRPESLRGFPARMQDWGRLDASAALLWLAEREAGPLFLVGYSVGGQLVALLHGRERLRAVLAVAASTGTWWQMSGTYRLFCAFVWYGFLALRLLGYLPARLLGAGEDLPPGVAGGFERGRGEGGWLLR